MTIINIIAAVDEQYGLGKNNQLLCHLPADLKHFKNLTMGKPVIMGLKTFESIGKPLPGRANIVLTKTQRTIDGVECVPSLAEAFALVSSAPEAMVIGGAKVFEQTISLATGIYLTLIHHQFDADVFFPKLDEQVWFCKEKHFRKRDEKNNYDLTFYYFKRQPENVKN